MDIFFFTPAQHLLGEVNNVCWDYFLISFVKFLDFLICCPHFSFILTVKLNLELIVQDTKIINYSLEFNRFCNVQSMGVFRYLFGKAL